MQKQKIKIYFWFLFGIFLILPNNSQAADIEASASRTSGVAPLAVHFNADLTASSETERSFHDLDYSWDFGDGGSGVWGTDGKSKNSDKGPVGFHVYDNPGSYAVTLTVRNESGIIDTDSWIINVTDPDIYYSGVNTTCISNDIDFTGCPSGSSRIIMSSLNSIASYVGSGKRVLLKRGSSFTADSPLSLGASTTFHLGAFGTCSAPDPQGICSNAPIITHSGIDHFIDLGGKVDWRITDLSLIGSKTTPGLFSGTINLRQMFFYRLATEGFMTPMGWTHWRNSDSDRFEENAVVGCKFQNFGDTGTYIGSNRLAFVGNNIHNSDITHVVRIWLAHIGVISHNIVSGSSLTNMNGRHALKLHGPMPVKTVSTLGVCVSAAQEMTVSDALDESDCTQGGGSTYNKCKCIDVGGVWDDYNDGGQPYVGTFNQTGGPGLLYLTKWVVISNNIFGSSGPWPVSIGPQNGALSENLSDIVFEKNKVIAQYGETSPVKVSISVGLEGQYITARNNIIDGTGGDTSFYGIQVWRRGVEWEPVGNSIYNNTIYSKTSHTVRAYGVNIASSALNTVVKNNLSSFPDTIVEKLSVKDDSGVSIISNNILTDTPYFIDPDNVNPLSRNFSLTPNSIEAINQGYTVPFLDDFSGNPRIAPYDIGAFEYIESLPESPNSPTGLSII